MKKIQILGTGCPNCSKLAANAQAAAAVATFQPSSRNQATSITASTAANAEVIHHLAANTAIQKPTGS